MLWAGRRRDSGFGVEVSIMASECSVRVDFGWRVWVANQGGVSSVKLRLILRCSGLRALCLGLGR